MSNKMSNLSHNIAAEPVEKACSTLTVPSTHKTWLATKKCVVKHVAFRDFVCNFLLRDTRYEIGFER